MAIITDSEGFLTDYLGWTEGAAARLAKSEKIVLGDAHWEVIRLVREYYTRFHVSPTTRVLTKIVGDQLGKEKGKSIYLMKLFTGKPAKIVAKVSGLPKPSGCD
ncbi:MAG: tRNA 2-thiouridine synthesizing protein E [Candidatus Azotimanducaceae bacterium]|jgi:tRNA 2-thiouridine synthesizing protein E